MSIIEKSAAGLTASLMLLAFAGAAVAQQPAPKPTPPKPPAAQHQAPAAPAPTPQAQAAPADQNPQRTTATYGDWIVLCEIAPGPPAQKNCQMEQSAAQSQNQILSKVVIGMPKGEPPKAFIILPINVSFAVPIKITIDAKDPSISTSVRRCIPGGCIAEIELKDDLQKKFRTAAEQGKLIYKNAGEQDVVLPLSFKGFAQAFDALLKQ
jgi:invasion protein IalB